MATDLMENKKLLIVDDERDVLETLEQLLSMCEVDTATSFEEAKNLLETKYYDMAVLDVMGVDGYKLLDIAISRDVIAVILTAAAFSVKDTIKSYKRGAASYVPKDKMNDIAIYLNDIFEADEKGKPFWWRWLDRFSNYYDEKFGKEWKNEDEDFMNKLQFWQ